MQIFVGCDHAGFGMKEKLLPYLRDMGHEVEDSGAFEYNEGDDYPDFSSKVAEKVSKNPDSSKFRGIIFGGSGQGEAIAANKFSRVRAMEYYAPSRGEISILEDSRTHNDSNILCIGARFLSDEEVKEAVRVWLETEFKGEERHK